MRKKGKCIFCGVFPVMRFWHQNVRWVLFWSIPEKYQLSIELWQETCNRSNLTWRAAENNLLAFNSPLLDVRKHSSFSFYLRNVFLISIRISCNKIKIKICYEYFLNADQVDKDAKNRGKIRGNHQRKHSFFDEMNPDRSLPIQCPFFAKGFLFLEFWFGRRKQDTTVF